MSGALEEHDGKIRISARTVDDNIDALAGEKQIQEILV